MRARLGRLVAAASVVVAASSVGAAFDAGTARAAGPVVLGSCNTSVQGAPGQPVSLSPAAVVQPVIDVVNAVPGGSLIAGNVRQAFLALPAIPIGAIPTGQGYISGGAIASAVVAQLNSMPVLGPVIGAVSGGVQGTLTQLCGIGVTGVNAAAGQVQGGAAAAAGAIQQGTSALLPPGGKGPSAGQPGGQSPPASQPGGSAQGGPGYQAVGGYSPGGAPLYNFGGGQFGLGRSAPFDYGDLPFAIPGYWAPSPGLLYGGQVPGYAPELGTLGPQQDDVQSTAGGVQALNPGRNDNRVGAPVLLAVVLLSCVTAALVRRWVLTRATVVSSA
jgi:hypothetical protein